MTRVLWLVMVFSAVQCSPMSRDELEDFSNFLLKTSSLDLHVKKGADPDDAFDEDEVASDHAWEESGKFEGDLILNDRQRRLIVENVEGLSRNGLTDSTKKWPNNEVIYFIQKEHFSSGQVQAIQDGIDDLAQASCVKFRPYRKGDRDAVVIQGSRRGCFSQVGYQGGYQVLNLSGRHPVGRGCFRHGTVVHELLHSLGFYHMQSSPDRDDYINVIWANIVQPARHNFRKYNSFSVSDFGVGYDYDSVLHYSRRAFSANGQDTLVPKKNGAEIGQRVGLSDKDTQKLNKMYCDADNDQALADENATQKPKNKKKKPKNQPFDGHGIGYHQGKTVVIKLPAAEPYKLSKAIVPSTHVFDFSKTPQIVSTPEAGGYRFGKEVTYLYKPTISLNSEVITENPSNYYVNPTLVNNVQKHYLLTDDKLESAKEDKKDKSSHSIKKSPEEKPKYVPVDEHDEDLKEAFHRLTAIVKQHVYPQNHDYGHKINKDYSTFLTTPLKLKQPNHSQDSINDNFNQSVSYSAPSHLLLVDVKQNQQEPNNNSNNKYSNNQVEDRMDTFYGVSLPTKKPYSSNEQTETPHYATLEYLQDRHDFSNIYSPIISKGGINNKHIEESPHKNVKYNHGSIKIIPYDHGFYTDNVQNYGKSNPTDVSKDGLDNKKENIDKYELDETSTEEPSVSIHKKLDDGIDSSYRTMLPTKKPYSSYEQTHTPTYATLEYLKDRHDISSLYTPKKPTDEKRTEPYTVIGRELPPTKSDGYNKDSYTQHSANYDQDSYADYIQLNRKNNMEETKDRITDIANNKDNDNENSPKSLNKPQVKTETVNKDEDFYTDYGSKENNERLTDDYKYNDDKKERTAINHHDEGYDDPNYFTQYKTEDSSLAEVPQYDNDEENIKESPKKNKSKHEIVKYYPDYYSSYEKEYNSRISNDNKNSKESPKSSTEDLYKSSHSIPDISHEDEYLGTHKDDYR